jgi:deazaflavin-dependent oxidoreductase (nitroreductase family)
VAEPNEFNQKIIEEFRANGGKVGGPFQGASMILITTTGAKSGAKITTPLVYLPDGDNMVIIASKGGAPNHPAWYHNLKANPDVTVDIGQGEFEAVAKEVTGQERDAYYARQVERMPGFAEYEKKTTRKIPVMVLSKKA